MTSSSSAAALVAVALSIVARVSPAAAFSAYPVLERRRRARGPSHLAGGLVVAALAPFANRRGLAR